MMEDQEIEFNGWMKKISAILDCATIQGSNQTRSLNSQQHFIDCVDSHWCKMFAILLSDGVKFIVERKRNRHEEIFQNGTKKKFLENHLEGKSFFSHWEAFLNWKVRSCQYVA